MYLSIEFFWLGNFDRLEIKTTDDWECVSKENSKNYIVVFTILPLSLFLITKQNVIITYNKLCKLKTRKYDTAKYR